MEDLILPAIVVALVVVALIGAVNSIWFWGTALLANLGLGLTLAAVRALAMRRPRLLARVVLANWDQEGSTLHWHVDEAGLKARSWGIAIAAIAVVPGIVYLINQRPVLIEAATKTGSDFSQFSMLLGGGAMALVATCGSAVLTHKMTEGFCAQSVRNAIDQFSAGTEQMKILETTERQIRSLSDSIGVDWPSGMSEDVNAYIQREKEGLLVNGKAFRRRVNIAVEGAQLDARMLAAALQRQEETVNAFKQTSRAANRAGAVTLVKELEGMHEAMTSEAMMSLLVERKWKEFDEIHQDMAADLKRILRQAEQYETPGKDASSISPATETPLEKAFRVLGVSESMNRDAIRKRYRQMAMDYHPDKASQATAAIRALAEERFKQIQEAWETIEEIHTS